MATGRENQRAQNFQELGKSWNREAIALTVVDGGMPVRFDRVQGPFVANTTDPNNAPLPADSEIFLGGGFNAVGLYPEWTGASQAVVLHVWARDASDTALLWRRIQILTFLGTVADLETIVKTGNRDIFVQVVSGADAGHPFSLHLSAF